MRRWQNEGRRKEGASLWAAPPRPMPLTPRKTDGSRRRFLQWQAAKPSGPEIIIAALRPTLPATNTQRPRSTGRAAGARNMGAAHERSGMIKLT